MSLTSLKMSFILVSIFASFANADNRFSHRMKSQEGDSVGAGNTADLDESVGLASILEDATDALSKGADIVEDAGSAMADGAVDVVEDVWDWLSEEQAAAFNEQSVGHAHGEFKCHGKTGEGKEKCEHLVNEWCDRVWKDNEGVCHDLMKKKEEEHKEKKTLEEWSEKIWKEYEHKYPLFWSGFWIDGENPQDTTFIKAADFIGKMKEFREEWYVDVMNTKYDTPHPTDEKGAKFFADFGSTCRKGCEDVMNTFFDNWSIMFTKAAIKNMITPKHGHKRGIMMLSNSVAVTGPEDKRPFDKKTFWKRELEIILKECATEHEGKWTFKKEYESFRDVTLYVNHELGGEYKKLFEDKYKDLFKLHIYDCKHDCDTAIKMVEHHFKQTNSEKNIPVAAECDKEHGTCWTEEALKEDKKLEQAIGAGGLPSGNGQKRKPVGTCDWMSCDTSHGPTVCNQKAQCVCARGYHTLDGKTCVPKDGPCADKLMTTDGTCSIGGCHSWRGKTVCSMGACQCLPGWWSLDGKKCDQQCAPGSGAHAGDGKKRRPVGTCAVTSCSGSHGPTMCNQKKQCVCAREYHTLDGKTCVPNDGPCKDKPIATDGTCSLFKCQGNTVCRAGTCICRPGFFTTPDGSESCASTCPSPSGEVKPKVTLNTYSLLLNEFEYVLFYGLALVGLLTILAFLRFAFQNNEYKTVVDEMSKLEELSAEI